MQAIKGEFVIGAASYKWQVIIDGRAGFGNSKKEAVAAARAAAKQRKEDEAQLDNFNWVGSRHHY